MSIRNEGPDPDRLTGAQSIASGRVELHRTTVENGMARMQPVPILDIPPRSEVRLEPNGLHLMLVDLRAPLVAGSTFPLLVEFRSGMRVAVDVSVRAARSGMHSTH